MRHKVTYTVKVHGQGGASKCLDVLRASTIELSQWAIRNKQYYLRFSLQVLHVYLGCQFYHPNI